MIKTGQAWAGLFVTLDATGAASAADSTPTGTLYVDGVSDAATVTITGSNPYKFAVTLPTLTAGQRVDMYIAATIDTIATAGIVASAQADTALVSDVKAETAAILVDTGTTLDGKLNTIDTNVDSILADTGTDGVVVASIATDAITADALNADAVDEIIDEVIVGTYTMRQILTILASAMAGKVSGGGTSTITFRGVDDASDVIVATVDALGNRSALTITV